MAKKKMDAEERKEFKRGKYMGGPAEEKAEKKKGKRMAMGGRPEGGPMPMRGGMQNDAPGAAIGRRRRAPAMLDNPGKPRLGGPGPAVMPKPVMPAAQPAGLPAGTVSKPAPNLMGMAQSVNTVNTKPGYGLAAAANRFNPPSPTASPANTAPDNSAMQAQLGATNSAKGTGAAGNGIAGFGMGMTASPYKTSNNVIGGQEQRAVTPAYRGGGLARKGVGQALAKGGLVKGSGCAQRGVKKPRMV